MLIGATALAIAEFAPLYRVQTDIGHHIERSVSAGSHHAYALLPIAVLAALLAGQLGRSGRPVSTALIILGLAVLGIALLGDLPDLHRTGVLGTPATGLNGVHTVAGAGLYLETLGAVALLAAGAAGLVINRAVTPPASAAGRQTSVNPSGS